MSAASAGDPRDVKGTLRDARSVVQLEAVLGQPVRPIRYCARCAARWRRIKGCALPVGNTVAASFFDRDRKRSVEELGIAL
jgi:hypothetical protein